VILGEVKQKKLFARGAKRRRIVGISAPGSAQGAIQAK
jgi:hypothetical protein